MHSEAMHLHRHSHSMKHNPDPGGSGAQGEMPAMALERHIDMTKQNDDDQHSSD
jgi:hypothetical protein